MMGLIEVKGFDNTISSMGFCVIHTQVCVCVCVCEFGFNVPFNNFSVIS